MTFELAAECALDERALAEQRFQDAVARYEAAVTAAAAAATAFRTLLGMPIPDGKPIAWLVPPIFKWYRNQLHVTHMPCHNGEEFSLIIPNASTQGPPTSSAVQVNLGNSSLLTKSSLLT